MERGRSLDVSEASSRSSSGWFGVLQEDLKQQINQINTNDTNANDDQTDFADDNDFVAASTRSASTEPQETLTQEERHRIGSCNPCILFAIRSGCFKGEACPYCHFPHESNLPQVKAKGRPRKGIREKTKADLEELLKEAQQGGLDQIQDRIQEEAEKCQYTRKLLVKWLDDETCWGVDGTFRSPNAEPKPEVPQSSKPQKSKKPKDGAGTAPSPIETASSVQLEPFSEFTQYFPSISFVGSAGIPFAAPPSAPPVLPLQLPFEHSFGPAIGPPLHDP